jgi:excisionase family DNA binding protein
MKNRKLLTVIEAARRLKISRVAVYKAIARGALKKESIRVARVMVTAESVDRYEVDKTKIHTEEKS